MANSIVGFRFGTWAQYNDLAYKDPNVLYFISDSVRQEIWKGDVLFGRGTVATTELAGLLSAEDKRALDDLIAQGPGAVPTYSMELQSSPEDGSIATYKLKKTFGGTSTYVGDPINIPKDKVISSGSLAYAPEDDNPYPGAVKGDPYLDLIINDASSSHVYIPVKGLVSPVQAGNGINIASNIVSIQLDAANAHGLKVTEAGLALDLVTPESDGAMRAQDKAKLDRLPDNLDDYALTADVDAKIEDAIQEAAAQWGLIDS